MAEESLWFQTSAVIFLVHSIPTSGTKIHILYQKIYIPKEDFFSIVKMDEEFIPEEDTL